MPFSGNSPVIVIADTGMKPDLPALTAAMSNCRIVQASAPSVLLKWLSTHQAAAVVVCTAPGDATFAGALELHQQLLKHRKPPVWITRSASGWSVHLEIDRKLSCGNPLDYVAGIITRRSEQPPLGYLRMLDGSRFESDSGNVDEAFCALSDVLTGARRDVPLLVKQMRVALVAQNVDAARHHLHTLSGLAGTMRAVALETLVRRHYQRIKQSAEMPTDAAVELIDALADDALQALQMYRVALQLQRKGL